MEMQKMRPGAKRLQHAKPHRTRKLTQKSRKCSRKLKDLLEKANSAKKIQQQKEELNTAQLARIELIEEAEAKKHALETKQDEKLEHKEEEKSISENEDEKNRKRNEKDARKIAVHPLAIIGEIRKDENNIWHCKESNECSRRMRTEKQAVTHYYSKHIYRGRKRPEHCKCPYCPKTYKDIRNLQAHLQIINNGRETGNWTGKCDFAPGNENAETRWAKTIAEIEETIENEEKKTALNEQQNTHVIINE